jgi:hypothetical protein
MSGVSSIYSKGEKTGTRKARGRKDSEGQEAVIKHHVLLEKETELVNLANASNNAATDFGEAIKACAEASGYNAAAVRKYIAAKVGEHFDDEKKKVEQLSLIFGV